MFINQIIVTLLNMYVDVEVFYGYIELRLALSQLKEPGTFFDLTNSGKYKPHKLI